MMELQDALSYINEDYIRIYVINLETKSYKCLYKNTNYSVANIEAISDTYKDDVSRILDLSNLKETLLTEKNVEYEYVVNSEYRRIKAKLCYDDTALIYVSSANKIIDYNEVRIRQNEEIKKQYDIIRGLSGDYTSIFLINLRSGIFSSYKITDEMFQNLLDFYKGRTIYLENIKTFIDSFVYEEDKDSIMYYLDPQKMRVGFKKDSNIVVNFRVMFGDVLEYFQIKLIKINDEDVVVGFRSIDEEMKKEKENNEILENALKEARYASKVKSDFLSNMSHDIRTPMNAIVGFTQIAINNINNKPKVHDALLKINSSSNHLLSLINDILDMSKIESGKITLDESEHNLVEILYDVSSMVESQIRTHNITFDLDTSGIKNTNIFCDSLRLKQIFINFLSNSIKFTNKGGISVKVNETEYEEGISNYEFIFSDTGVGISEEFINKLFLPFERETSSSISKIEGSGLGLSICKNFVEMMGGTISVKSEKDKGTTFFVNIVFKNNRNVQIDNQFDLLIGKKVLIVDSNPITSNSLSNSLQNQKMNVTVIHNIRDLLLNLKHNSYDFFIIDHGDGFGFDLCKKIRNTCKDNPFIILTTYDVINIKNKAFEMGVDALCKKPYNSTDMKNIMKNLYTDTYEEEEVLSYKDKRVLIFEDNFLNQEIIKEFLFSSGLQIEFATNGQIGLEMYKSKPTGYYDLIFMDIQMPIMDGYQATMEIRKSQKEDALTIPIIAMTANAFADDIKKSIDSGMNDHIAKPIDINTLYNLLDKIFK